MSTIKNYILIILLIISITLNFIQRSCSNNTTSKSTVVQIKTPEIIGSVKKSTVKKIDTTSNKIQYKDKIAYVENPVTQSKLNSYIMENDSLKRLKMYGDAITIHKQINTFENKYFKIDVQSEVEGKLLNLSLSQYTLKSQELPVTISTPKEKETSFALYAGGGGYYSSQYQKLDYKAGITLQNKKGDLLTIESDFKKQPTIFLDYKFRIFNYKK